MQIKKFYLVAALSFMAVFVQAQKNISVLFIGNSYTHSNNLPNMLQQLGYAMGDSIFVDSYAPGGYSLLAHSQDSNTINKIKQQAWDYVVLQDQSQRPSLEPAFVDTAVIPYALFLDSLIHNNNACTQTVFYMTWGRKYGDVGNCPFYPPVCTYAGMQQRLKDSYLQMADTCHAIVSPVGEAFNLSIQTDSTLNLYVSDNSHPSVEGSYLAACTFYATILHKQITNQNYTAGLSISTAAYLQYIAWQTVTDSLLLWNLALYEPFAHFTFQSFPNLQMQFYCPGNLSFQHLWNFGDTTYSSAAEPLHQYLYSYYFPVTHIVYDGCHYDSVTYIVNATGQLNLDEIQGAAFTSWFDKRTDDIMIVLKDAATSIMLFDLNGKRIKTQHTSPLQTIEKIDAINIINGTYIIQVNTNSETKYRKKIPVIK